MRVTAIVVNWNGADDLPGCLDGLLAQDHRPFEVVVVDNASTDGSAAVLDAYEDPDGPVPLRVVRNRTNRGFAGGANDGIATAHGAEAVLVCNPDVRPAPDHARRAVAALIADDRRGAVQGKLLRTVVAPGGEDVVDTTGHVAFRTRLFRNRGEGEVDRGQWDVPGEVFGVSGALALYRTAMLRDVATDVLDDDGTVRSEVFDEDLFAFWEDVDLDWRAAMRGWQAWYAPDAVAHHERGGAGPRRTARVEQLNWQNRLLTVAKDDSWRAVLPALPGLLLTTLLKTGELALTVPSAFLAALREWRLLPRMLRKRRALHARATVTSAEVVDRWFEPFDYAGWVRTWWRRVRGVPVGHEAADRPAGRRLACHLVDATAWREHPPGEDWSPASLADEGFVHLSWPEQVDATVRRHLGGVGDVLVLHVDLDAVGARVEVEDTSGRGEAFPHVYGPLPAAAVTDVRPWLPPMGG